MVYLKCNSVFIKRLFFIFWFTKGGYMTNLLCALLVSSILLIFFCFMWILLEKHENPNIKRLAKISYIIFHFFSGLFLILLIMFMAEVILY